MNNDEWYRVEIDTSSDHKKVIFKDDNNVVKNYWFNDSCNWKNNPLWFIWTAKYYNYNDFIDWILVKNNYDISSRATLH